VIAASLALIDRPVQLTLALVTRPTRRRSTHEQRPYWDYADLADLGGELHARRHCVKVLLGADHRSDGTWVGYHDLVLGTDGSNGCTKAHATRQDALISAAYQLAGYCRDVIARGPAAQKSDVAAARQLLRWLQRLDLV
jgi:hypothetical protein